MRDKIDTFLNISDPDFADRLTEALGVKKGDSITIVTPQFDRVDGLQVPIPLMDFEKLPELSDETLKQIGCQKWDESDNEVHWLYPGEWYNHIPEGTEMLCINGKMEKFERGKTDADTRYGALAYGFMKSK